MALHWLLAQGVARSKRLSRIFEGSAIELAREGNHDKSQLLQHAISEGDLAEALKRAGIERIPRRHG